MIRTLRAGALTAVALLLTLPLTGCAGEAPAVETASSTPVASPSPEPTVELDPLEAVGVIVVRSEALELVDAAGSIIRRLSYDAPAEEFVGTLATVFGAEPATADWEGGMETPPRRDYEWEGFTVTDDLVGRDDPIDMNVSIMAAQAVVGDGVEIRTVDGFRPGDDMAAFAAATGADFAPGSATGLPAEFGPDLAVQSDWSSYPNANAVMVFNYEQREPGSGDPGWISAPWNFGIGHV
jgi:hypothetical protein